MRLTNRRTFLEKLGLGAGGALLAPIASSLISEAHGAPQTRKRIVFFLTGNGMSPSFYFTPPEFQKPTSDPFYPNVDAPVMNAPVNFTWPAMAKALEPYRARTMLVDGLANVIPNSQHSGGFAALSNINVARGAAEYDGSPGGITIDQFIANTLSANTPHKSVLYGVSRDARTQEVKVFAAGREKPEPHFVNPKLLFNRLFGTIGQENRGGLDRQRLLLDAMRTDAARLQAALAPTERRKLEHYLAAIEEFEKRQKLLGTLNCKSPSPPADFASEPPIEDKLEAQHEMGILALACGLTNVVGVASGCGNGHGSPSFGRLHIGTRFESEGRLNFYGHGAPADKRDAQTIIHNYHCSLIARMVSQLSQIKEGDGSIFDNTVIVYLNDNAEAHHSNKDRWPMVIVGNAGGALKSDGRFVRFPLKGKTGWRSMADFFCTLSTAVGVPTETFGKGGIEAVKGPIAELMT